jgi:hypothetical protein
VSVPARPARPARLNLARLTAIGVLFGLPLALAASVLVVWTGYPDWARTVWQLVVILAGIGLGMSLVYWLIAYAVWYGTQAGFDRKQPIPSYAFFLARPVIVATVAMLIIAAALTAVFSVGAGESLL